MVFPVLEVLEVVVVVLHFLQFEIGRKYSAVLLDELLVAPAPIRASGVPVDCESSPWVAIFVDLENLSLSVEYLLWAS